MKQAKFLVYNYEWHVVLTDNKEDLMANGKLCKGCTHYTESTIFISTDTSPKDRIRLLLHELSHAFIYETQIELKQSYTEEDLCEFMAKLGPAIMSVYKDLIPILLEDKK